MSAVSRNKGARGEREVVRIQRESGWPDAQRTARGTTQRGVGDVACGPAGYHQEVKRDERLSMEAALRQLRADCLPGQEPVLIRRWNGDPQWWACITLDEWLALVRARDELETLR